MYVCASFHEIPAKGLQDIKETKCYGRDGRTDNVKTVYPPYNFVIAGGIMMKYKKLTYTQHEKKIRKSHF